MSIRPTFTGIYTARSGVASSQYNLDITGQNLTNALTPGYTRQRTDLMAIGDNGYLSTYADSNGIYIGQGVQIVGTSQLRDPGYDIRYRLENTDYGYHETKVSGLEDMERIFDEIMLESGLHGLLTDEENSLRTALQNLSTDPNNESLLRVVKGKFTAIIDKLHENKLATDSVWDQQLNDFEITVDKVNTLLGKIGELNKLIDEDAQYNNPAHELKDQRNLLLDELSGYMDMDYAYDKNGKLSINMKSATGEKIPLVQGDKVASLTLHKEAHDGLDALHIRVDPAAGMRDQDGNLMNSKVLDADDVSGGSLGAYYDLLQGDGLFGTDITNRGVVYYQNMLDTFAATFAQNINDLNRGRLDISADGSLIIPSAGYGSGKTGTAVTDESALLYFTDKNGNEYSMTMGEFMEADGLGFQRFLEGDPADPTDDKAAADFLEDGVDPTDPAQWREALIKGGVYLKDQSFNLITTNDGTNQINAENISLSKGWEADNKLFQAALSPDKLGEDSTAANNNILRYIKLMQDESKIEFVKDGKAVFSGTWATFITSMQEDLGHDVGMEALLSKSFKVNVDALEDRRMSISGVDENEEAANMIMYQKAFQASSRLMTTIDEMLDKLINGTGIVGR